MNIFRYLLALKVSLLNWTSLNLKFYFKKRRQEIRLWDATFT